MISLRIASLNTMGLDSNYYRLKQRMIAIGQLFTVEPIEILLLQEVFSYSQLRILRQHLPTFQETIYQPALFGPRGGLVIFSKIPLQLITYTSFPFTITPLSVSLPESLFRKGILLTKITSLSVWLANTHFTAVLDRNWSEQGKYWNRKEMELKTLGKLLTKIPASDTLLVGGDFNINYESDMYRQLLVCSLHNIFENQIVPTHESGACIDYLFSYQATDDLKIKSCSYIPNHRDDNVGKHQTVLSDHLGLRAEFGLR